MPKPSPEELYSWELNILPIAAALLKEGGVPVISPFLPPPSPDAPEYQAEIDRLLKDKHAIVTFEPAPIDPNVKAFATGVTDAEDGLDSIEAGWGGDLVVEHSVPVDDKPPAPGEIPGCYWESLRLSGRIRALLLSPKNPFAARLPYYQFLSIRYVQPQRGIDQPRSANQATERFRFNFMPARGAL
jgi:hypothetical protein